jgi:signal peptidase I
MKRRRGLLLMALVLAVLVGCSGNASSGDRVVVAKFLYDSHLESPERYEVVVFKYPKEPVKVRDNPERMDGRNPGQVATNYIKRLLGLPGELLAIFFGRIYRCDPDASRELRQQFAARDSDVSPLDLWKLEYMHRDDPDARELFRRGKFEILRKPPPTMLTMRRLVNDFDHQAKDLKDVLPPRWVVDTGSWTADTATGFRYDSASAAEVSWLKYQHILRPENWPQGREAGPRPPIREADKKPQLIRDFLGYNSYETARTHEDQSNNWVGDLMLEFELTVDRADGEVWLELARGVDRFQARFSLATGDCTLFRISTDPAHAGEKPGQPQELQKKPTGVNKPGTYQLRFANFDDRLTVWVGRDLPFGDGVAYPAPAQPGPTINDLRPALIGSKGAGVKVHHLKLFRDTYYTTRVSSPDARGSGAEFWSNPERWQVLREIEPATFYVQPDHYMCMGDNSPASSDSRSWGTVPERLMLGRALVVYWPFGRAGAIE